MIVISNDPNNRLYETQVKKIVKVQSMMRVFLARRNLASKLKKFRQESSKSLSNVNVVGILIFSILMFISVQKEETSRVHSDHHLTDAEAAIAIQKGIDQYELN